MVGQLQKALVVIVRGSVAVLDEDVGVQIDRRFDLFLQKPFRPLPDKQIVAILFRSHPGDGFKRGQVFDDHDELLTKHRGIGRRHAAPLF
jgi:hypothetical protein